MDQIIEPGPLIDDLEFGPLLATAPFTETHHRVIDAPVERVWDALLTLPGDDIRLLRPLFRLRSLPATLTGRDGPHPVGARPTLELFQEEGFQMLRRDPRPNDGHALMIFGAAGKFWLPTGNGPVRFTSAEEFLAFDRPGNAKTVARFEAWEEDGRTRLETETRVVTTDAGSEWKFGAYWAIIRGPSGLLRRSWLAATERRARN